MGRIGLMSPIRPIESGAAMPFLVDRPRWQRWGGILGLWIGVFTLLGIFDTAQTCLLLNAVHREIPFHIVLIRGMAGGYLWALLAPLLFWGARWVPLDGNHWARNLFLQGLASGVVSLVKTGLDIPFVVLFN